MKLNIQLFAGSCSIGTITETTDINTNQSTFTIPATLTTSGSTYNNDNAYMTLQWRYSGGSSWTTISKKTFGIGQNSSKTKSWTLSLTHEDDGTLTDVQFRVQWYITSSTSGTSSTKTYSPTIIPRASDIDSITNGTTPYNPTIVWTPKNSSFRYKVEFLNSINHSTNLSYIIVPNQTTPYTYDSLEVNNNSYNNVDSITQTMTAILYTYKSDDIVNPIGTKTKTFTTTLNSNIKPTISISNLAEADETMQSLNWGIYVKGKSKLSYKINYSFPFPMPSSATLSSNTNGQNFDANASISEYTRTQTFTTNTLSIVGTNTITARATDSRTRYTDATPQTYTVVDYSNPTVSTAQVERCDENGNVTADGIYIKISYGASISSCSGNNTPYATYKVGYRIQNTEDYTYVPLTTNVNSYSASGILFTDGIKSANSSGIKVEISPDYTYDIQFYVEDVFTESTNVQSLDTGFDLMNFNASGKAMAIGKVSEAGANENLFEVALPTKFTEYVKDELVVESIRSKNMFDKNSAINGYYYTATGTGTSGNWYIEKIEVKSSTNYYLSGNNYSNTTARIVLIDSSNNIIQNVGGYSEVHLITTTSSTKYIGLSIADYDGTGDMNTLQLEEGSIATNYSTYQHFEISNWVDKSSEITINNNNIQTNRTKLFVNENLRLVFLQVFYTATVSSTVSKPIQYPYMYKPAFLSSDQLWFTMSPSNGGANTCRGTIKYDTTNGTYIDIFTVSNSVAAPFGNIVYPY